VGILHSVKLLWFSSDLFVLLVLLILVLIIDLVIPVLLPVIGMQSLGILDRLPGLPDRTLAFLVRT
jgi:hypothetical protein